MDPARRLFFAYWPDEATRQAAARAQASLTGLAGRRVPAVNFHLTLAFLGLQGEERLRDLMAVGEEVAAAGEACRIRLKRLEYWRGPRIWAAVGPEIPAPARQLYLALWQALVPLGLPPDTRPWRPHLTLIRPAKPGTPPAWAPLTWPADRLVLAESVSRPGGAGPRYPPLGEWVVP